MTKSYRDPLSKDYLAILCVFLQNRGVECVIADMTIPECSSAFSDIRCLDVKNIEAMEFVADNLIAAHPKSAIHLMEINETNGDYKGAVRQHYIKYAVVSAKDAGFNNSSDLIFDDIYSEAERIYNFGQKGFVKIKNPIKLAVSNSGGHRIFDATGTSHYIPHGWIHLSWTAKQGQPNFVK